MAGSKSPSSPTAAAAVDDTKTNGADADSMNDDDQRSPDNESDEGEETKTGIIAPSAEQSEAKDAEMTNANGTAESLADGEADAASEAETLIDSPVKRKEAAKQRAANNKKERAPRHRIGGLPVPTDNDDEGDSAAASPMASTEMSVEKAATSTEEAKDEERDRADDVSNNDDGSDPLSSPRSTEPSRATSPSRAASEQPEHARDNGESPNPRKRKHRASSVSLPNKRPSVDMPRRRLRGGHSEEALMQKERSASPKSKNHRRAASTQSAVMDGAETSSRKRKTPTAGSRRESKVGKSGWDESDASSETTSHGHVETLRPRRGIGRSTSTPGRPTGREHKRHVNKYGFTKLAEACEVGDLDLVKEWREKDPDQLEVAEFAGNKPLQIAALNGNVEVVDYLIEEGCQIDCANVDKDTPLIDAAENGHVDVVKSLLSAGVDPLRQNLKGQQALDVVTDDTDDADEIRKILRQAIDQWNSDGAKQRREEEEELRHRAGPTKELHFMARTYENLLRLVQINDRNGVREFLDARVPVDNAVIAAAAKTGDLYLVNMLLAEMTEKKSFQKPEKPMLSVLGTAHFEMVKSLTELDQFNSLWRSRQGKSWPELAEERHGPMWRQEKDHLQKLFDLHNSTKESRSSSPITKRDAIQRRAAQRSPEDESEDEVDAEDEDEEQQEAPKRKNGRRLMSKRDMRVTSGKALSESSSDESNSETAAGGAETRRETSMKPPLSPAFKRGSGRSRTKSFSAQPSEASYEPRRRSSSLRSDKILPKVEENGGKDEAAEQAAKEEEERRQEEARKLEAKRQEEAEAAALAAKREAEEKEKAEKMAEEARRAEEERQAEEARKAEEERQRIEAELAEAKRVHRQEVIACLPSTVSHVLDPQSSFAYDNPLALNYLLHHFSPLQVVKHEPRDSFALIRDDSDAPFWVVNVQAAPLMGQQSTELMLRADAPGFQGSLADTWETKDVTADDMDRIESVLSSLPQESSSAVPVGEDGRSLLSFEEELQRAANRANSLKKAKTRLRNGDAILRYVRLDNVLDNLHPSLKSAQVEVRFDYLAPPKQRLNGKENGAFVETVAGFLSRRPRPQTYINGQPIGVDGTSCMGATPVMVVHQK